MPFGQRRFDRRLALKEPVERRVQLRLGHGPEARFGAQARGRGRRIEGPGRAQLGAGVGQPRHDHGDRQVPAAVAGWPENAVEVNGAQRAEYGADVSVRQGPLDHHRLLAGRNRGAALEQDAQALDHLAG